MIKLVSRFISKDPKLYHDSLHPSLQLLWKIIGKDRRPAAHILSFELLEFIRLEKLQTIFPSMSDWTVHKNITLMHLSLLNQRLLYEETKESLKESRTLFSICEKYLFERYLDLVEDIIDVPVNEFEAELVEILVKDFENIDNEIACYGFGKAFIVLEERPGYNMRGVICE